VTTSVALKISELFDSLQGEGPSAGAPATFLRLALCNLRCSFCDTRYTWDWQRFDYDAEVRAMSVEELAPRLSQASGNRLIVTGGEPLVQARALAELLAALPAELVVEVETNGTLLPSAALLERVNQWNVSPKLENSGEARERRFEPAVLTALLATGRAWLKLVVASGDDCAEAERLALEAGFPRERVLFMPLASSRAELAERAPLVASEALARRVRYSPRLHVELWEGRRGV
jgi:7-carboxy-7-deazaguanine synthase